LHEFLASGIYRHRRLRRTIMELGGWNDLSMVQRYSHLSPNHKRDAIEKIVQEFPNAIHNTALSVV
jgi:hypothetical protein